MKLFSILQLAKPRHHQLFRGIFGLVLLTVFGSWLECHASDDWPMWRYDAQRSASSPNQPPTKPELLWKQSYGARVTAWDDPLNQDLMPYDRIFEPIVVSGKVLLGFNDQDKLVALDATTGKTSWTFFAEAPIRFAPAAWRDRIFVCSDDGYLYCLSAESGELLWKFSGTPNAQHALGNKRLTSAWPARGAPVVREDKLYFAASIWPFMGTFIYALDCETGKLLWVNDSTGSQYIKQPHSAPSFAGVGPQGYLVVTNKFLIVPGGRSVPAVFDRADGKFKHFEINAGGKGTGGSFVAADEKQFFVHTRLNGTRAFHIESGKKTAFMPCEPVIRGEFLYAAAELNGQRLINCYLANQEADENREPEWSFDANASDDLIGAGDHLVASGAGKVSIIKLPSLVDGDWKGMKVLHELAIGQPVKRVLVADQKVLCVTEAGDIYCYGDSNVTERSADQKTNATDSSAGQHSTSTATSADQPVKISDQSLRSAEKRLADWLKSGQAEGYAFWFGPCNPPMVEALAKATPFVQLAIVDSDSTRVHQTRQQLDRLGVYGRITVHQAKPRDFKPPQYVAHMVFVTKPNETAATDEDWQAIYSAVRPFGGTVIISAAENNRAKLQEKLAGLKLEQAEIQTSPTGLIIKRNGPLPGADDWTHQYGSIANTLKSDDSRVKLPLGILWFGGSSNMDVLPRHGHGPPQQVLGGRLYIEGMNSISARDVYTGRVLWQREFENLGTHDVYFDDTYDNKPLDPKYNQVHIPGANARGTNYVVTEDRVYLVVDNHCKILDAVTGKDLGKIDLPKTKSGDPEWGFIGVYKDVLLGGVGFANYRNRNSLEFETDSLLALTKIGFGSKSLDRAASRALIAYDRKTGEQLWRVDANHSFWHNGIVAGGDRIYMLDRNPAIVEDAMKRRGIAKNDAYRIIAVDYKNGQTLWEAKESITGTWLGYSEKHDLLLHARSAATDRLSDESGRGMRVYNAKDGSVLWTKDKLSYSGPCIIHNNWIITNANAYAQSAGAFDIRTGEQRMTKNPLTGKFQPWKITRAYGCNNIIASENMLTFRSGAAGYYDLLTESGTGNLGGFKSGCTSNLVVAGGVLNAPDYTRTCSCAYQNQTSLALVHMPGLDTWATNFTAVSVPENEIIQDLAINIGAPGDRRDSSGTLWLDFPAVGGDSPALALTLDKEAKFFQQQTATFDSSSLPWVYASGAYDLREMRLILRTQKRAEPPPKSADDDDEKPATTTAASGATTANSTSTNAGSSSTASNSTSTNSSTAANNTSATSATSTTNSSSAGAGSTSAASNTAASNTAASNTAAATTTATPPVIEVLRDPIPPTAYRLELYFSLPTPLENQQHQFEVKVKDQIRIVELAPRTQTADDDEQVYHSITFDDVVLDGELVVEFDAKLGTTVLSGFRLTKSQKK